MPSDVSYSRKSRLTCSTSRALRAWMASIADNDSATWYASWAVPRPTRRWRHGGQDRRGSQEAYERLVDEPEQAAPRHGAPPGALGQAGRVDRARGPLPPPLPAGDRLRRPPEDVLDGRPPRHRGHTGPDAPHARAEEDDTQAADRRAGRPAEG